MQLEVKSLEIAAKQSWRIQHLKPRERENPQPIQKKKGEYHLTKIKSYQT